MSNRKLSPAARQCCPHCGGSLAPVTPAAPRRSAGSFADRDSFVAAFAVAAARATAECGARWMLDTAARVVARVPAAWVNYRVHRRAVAGRRDMTLPAARFWPEGRLPIGPDYAPEPTHRAPGELHRIAAARCERDRDDALCFAARAARGINPAAERRERERWIDAAHAAERARMDYLRLADRAEAGAPEPEPTAPEPLHRFRYRLAGLTDGRGAWQEAYVAEDAACCVFATLAEDPATVWLLLTELESRRVLAQHNRPEPEPVPAAPAPVEPPAAPSAPVAPPAPRRPVQPRPEPAANPILLAWWHDAAASWRAYQSPADHAALARCQEGIAALLAALPDAGRREPMIRAVKAGRAFPAKWFATEGVA